MRLLTVVCGLLRFKVGNLVEVRPGISQHVRPDSGGGGNGAILHQALRRLAAPIKLAFRRDHFRLALAVVGVRNPARNQFALGEDRAGDGLQGGSGVLPPGVRIGLQVVDLGERALKRVALNLLDVVGKKLGLKLRALSACGSKNLRIPSPLPPEGTTARP